MKTIKHTTLFTVTSQLGLYERQIAAQLGLSCTRARQLLCGTARQQMRYREAAAILLGVSVAELLELEKAVDGNRPEAVVVAPAVEETSAVHTRKAKSDGTLAVSGGLDELREAD